MSDKVVFFDIDGTLLTEEKELPSSAKEAIFSLQQKGVHVAIATGRAPFMFKELAEELNIRSFVSFNGSYVVFEGEVVATSPLTQEQLTRLDAFAKENNHPMVFLNHETAKSNELDHPHIDESIASLKLPYPEYEPEFYKDRDIYQALLFCQDGEEKRYEENHQHFDYVRWHRYSIDVIPQGGSKAVGIGRLLEHLKVGPEQAFAFGDALNDLEMLQFVGTGIAMGNGLEQVKARANLVTKRVEEDGIYHGLKLVGLL
ncbi:Cof-type HAD-IIB family hydrolase [Halalkalibacterium halodurans]|uniref:BH2659 protein n=1 Tax=Halalkalibacterium halodurans (strain ATCC BAA-125 / DSM 18197 / FERM 7344 / JCM 9153 / C-125) TaxID=272558 RepID=Q9K9I8_HALH5|nr:Cof-type HAD-IIB family hydrolase [Halalkalibacterium halodurans]MDY7223193.1 Cof-type HAD-IIB family hydrolase [Halalkalibacterium halodurans]MDY7242414.1 Cof-type HAD-IIB family hydrolase [Halalkalibacterium halodurans]MED4079801.1 Cof-type HAD-IIB family hydrolase [Halalkalibacterium halodurans]MED4086257.1 Cof-type HAD-IIB family hydrolase [Halalkalibacterium halodurans]MED4103398.1 Cof-type HAD-IIB family hydrolase [Halalkalibacterium halodurans]